MANDTRVAELILRLTDQVSTTSSKIESSLRGVSTGVRTLQSVMGVSLGVGGMALYAKSLIDLGHSLSDLSEQTGLSIEVLGALKPIAEQTGASIEQFAIGILRAQKNLGNIHSEADPAALALKEIGLNVRELISLTPDQFLQRFAEALGTVEDRNKRVALVTQIFGRSAAELIPVLLQVADHGLPRLSSEAARGFKALGDLKDMMIRVTAETAAFWAALIGKGAEATSFSEVDAISRQIQNLSAFLANMKNRMGDAFEANPKMNELQARLTGLLTVYEKMTKAATQAKPAVQLGPDPVKVQNAIESLQKQIEALKAQEIELTRGSAAALRYRLSMQIATELGVDKLPPAIQKVIEALIRQETQFERTKLSLDALLASINDRADTTLERTGQQWRDFGKMVGDLVSSDGPLRELGKQMDLIAKETQVFGIEFDSTTARIDALKAAMVRLFQQGFQAASPEIENLKTQLESLKMVKIVENAFDSVAQGIQSTLEGVMQGTQTLKQGLLNMLRNVMLQVSNDLFKQLVLGPLKQAFTGLLSNIPGLGGALGGGAGDAGSTATFGSAVTTFMTAVQQFATSVGASGIPGLGGGGSGGLPTSNITESNIGPNDPFGMQQPGGFDLTSMFSDIFSSISDSLSGLMDGLMSSLSSMMGGMSDMFGSLIESLGSMLMSFLHGGGPVLAMPSFATGGEVFARLHQGEFVTREPAARRLGRRNLDYMNSTGELPGGAGNRPAQPLHVTIINDYSGALDPRGMKTTPKEIRTVVLQDLHLGGDIHHAIKARG